MPRDKSIESILVIGSGPIVIGQACEFDYSGTQALRSLREDGIETILINSNPATIMTDPAMADHVYLLPLTTKSIIKILKEHPQIDAVLPTMGGQTALNLCIEADEKGIWTDFGVDIIGVDIDTNIIFHKGIRNYIGSAKGIVLSGFVMRDAQLPNGTSSRQADILGWLYENTNIAKTLAEGEAVDFRYIIDTYEGEISGSSKYYLAKIAADNGQCLAILNAPSVKQFSNSTNPLFKFDNRSDFNPAYIPTGGNQDYNPTNTFTLPSLNQGSNYCGFYHPYLIMREGASVKLVPPAAYVSNNYMRHRSFKIFYSHVYP